MRRADAVDVRRAIRNREITRVHHPQIDVQRFPKLPRAPRSRLRALASRPIRPDLFDPLAALGVLTPVFVQPANIRLEPRVEHGHARRLQEFANAIAPTELLLPAAGRYEANRAGKINTGALQQPVLFVGAIALANS